jgi:hypothetical protein
LLVGISFSEKFFLSSRPLLGNSKEPKLMGDYEEILSNLVNTGKENLF